MSELQLNPEQHQALSDTLESVLSDLSVEIANTDLKSFRDKLKRRRDALKQVLDLLH